MVVEINIAPPNSVLLVMDRDADEIPKQFDEKLVVATPACIAIGTRSSSDGETCITLTNAKSDAFRWAGCRKAFSGVLATPNGQVDVYTVLHEIVAELRVESAQTKIEVWTNHENEPDRVCVLIAD